ncbi:MAG: exodeoxyribonuclease V subunit gamma [Rhabdochlamydiaceae bacterium]|nr:exodeoxyribonuclease V subunit gamma [Candidatus Amphrikana amoebophyrae]
MNTLHETIFQVTSKASSTSSKNGLQIYFSNNTHALVEKLKRQLYSPNNIFTRKLLIPPCDSVKNHIEKSFCQEADLGVFMGVRSLNLNLAMGEVLKIFPKPHFFGSQSEIAFFLEGEIRKIIQNKLHPIYQYIEHLPNKDEGIATLSDKLAGLFLRYGLYFGQSYENWKSVSSWQQELYIKAQKLFSFPIDTFKAMSCKSDKTPNYELHIFGLPHIPPIFLNALNQIASTNGVDVHLYLLSYSAFFWGDLLSSKQHYALKKGEKEKGVSESELDQLEDYYEAQNPLFSNLCRYGQPFFSDLLEMELPIQEYYIEGGANTVLEKLQNDFYHLSAPPQEKEEIELDNSLLFFRAPNKMREIENLHSSLLQLIEIHGTNTDDIVVLAPSIDEYAPFIESVFGCEDSPVGFTIESLQNQMKFEVYKLMDHLLKMVKGRWEREDIIQLLDFQIVRQNLSIRDQDFSLIKEWFDKTGFIWGYNSEHRSQFIQNSFSQKGTLDSSFSQLVLALAMDNPHINCEFSIAPLIEKLILFFNQLFIDTQEIATSRLNLKQWHIKCVSFFSKYSQPTLSSPIDERNQFDTFTKKLKSLFKLHNQLEENLYSFCSILPNVKRLYMANRGVIRSFGKCNIRFTSIQVGEAYFADIVALIGMDQSKFPRIDEPCSFDQLHIKELQTDYVPSSIHMDRYFFLEAICNAQTTLIISSLLFDSEGNKEEFATPVTELIHHLNRLYTFPSSQLIKHVNELKFNFNELQSCYLKSPFDWANQYYFGNNNVKPALHLQNIQSQSDSIITLDIQSLVKLARNPIQYVCNELLKVFHNRIERDELWLKEFVLSNLDRGVLRFSTLNKPINEVIAQIEKEQHPFSSQLFSKVAKLHLQEDLTAIEDSFVKFGIKIEDLFSVTLSGFTTDHPPLIVKLNDQVSVHIKGTIHHLFEGGLVVPRASSFEEYTKIWPQFLVLQALDLPQLKEKGVYFMRDGKSRTSYNGDSSEALKELIIYALSLNKRISLFLPTLAESILNEDEKKFKKLVTEIFADQTQIGVDPYFRWLFHNSNEVFAALNFKEFSQEMAQSFSHFKSWALG